MLAKSEQSDYIRCIHLFKGILEDIQETKKKFGTLPDNKENLIVVLDEIKKELLNE